MRFKLFVLPAVLLAGLLVAQTAPMADEEIWRGFEQWVAALKPLPPGESVLMRLKYIESLEQQGVAKDEAVRRFERVLTIRRGSVERERTYWDGSFKLGGGPSSPLRLLQESIAGVKPGKALDSAMGRGRNAIYLASTGWDVTGYDMSKEALRAAQESAKAAGVKLTTVEAKHESFEFGENQWDLVVCSYNYMGPLEPQWPGVFHRALRKGGLLVFQTSVGPDLKLEGVSENWKLFKVLKLEVLEAGAIMDDWAPSRTNRTVRLVAQKE